MTATEDAISPNFGFLAKRYPELERIAARSERYFSDDPILSLITLRQFGEGLAQLVAPRSGLYNNPNESQRDLLQRLRVDGRYPSNVLNLFNQLRKHGNAATHHHTGDHEKALACLNSRSDGTRDLGSRLFGVFPRLKRPRDERSLVLAADAEAVARPRDAAGKRHRHNLAHLAILVRRHSRLL